MAISLMRGAAFSGLIALLVSLTAPAMAADVASTLEIREEQYIVNPAGDGVVMIFDLFKQQASLKTLAPADRSAAAKTLATRVMDHYLATLPKAEAAALKAGTVALVYIPKRNEYQNPDLSSLQQLGVAKMVIKDGKSAVDGAVTGALQF